MVRWSCHHNAGGVCEMHGGSQGEDDRQINDGQVEQECGERQSMQWTSLGTCTVQTERTHLKEMCS